MTTTIVSTDGSALSNPNGPMGWGWANHNDRSHDAGGATNGTNQIGELCAVLQALRTHHDAEDLTIETDSQYAINCSTTWVHNWKKNGWRNAAKKPVKNVELIKAIDFEMHNRPGSVKFKWVKGHAGNEFNEIVDDLARGYAGDAQSGAQPGKLPLEGWQSLLNSPYRKGLEVPADVQAQLDGGTPAPAPVAVSTGDANDSSDAVDSAESSIDSPIEPPSAANGYGTLEQLSLFDEPAPAAEPEEPTAPEEDNPLQDTLF
jgi:ribonuclease HI